MEEKPTENQPLVKPQPSQIPYWIVFCAGLLGAVILLLGGVMMGYISIKPFETEKTTSETTTSTTTEETTTEATTDETADWQTYTNQVYGFEIKYPDSVTLYEEADEFSNLTYVPVCDPYNSVACFFSKPDEYKYTNFEGAGLSINIISSSNTEQKCNSFENSDVNVVQTLENKQINSINFSAGSGGGAATGHQIASKVYRTFYQARCFEITASITTDSSDVNTFPVGTVKTFAEADKQNVFDTLDQVLSTFKLTGASQSTTSEWNTFSNSTYGFSLKYPKDWVEGINDLNGTAKIVSFASSRSDSQMLGTGTIVAVFILDTGDVSYQNWLDVFNEAKNSTSGTVIKDDVTYSVSQISVDGKETIKRSNENLRYGSEPQYYIDTIIKRSASQLFVVQLETTSKATREKYDSTFTDILSSLNFTE